MHVHDQLVRYVRNRIRETGVELDFELNDTTSLLNSGLFDSLAVIDLAAWIQQKTGTQVDLMTIEPQEEWDTIRDILKFIAKHQQTLEADLEVVRPKERPNNAPEPA